MIIYRLHTISHVIIISSGNNIKGIYPLHIISFYNKSFSYFNHLKMSNNRSFEEENVNTV